MVSYRDRSISKVVALWWIYAMNPLHWWSFLFIYKEDRKLRNEHSLFLFHRAKPKNQRINKFAENLVGYIHRRLGSLYLMRRRNSSHLREQSVNILLRNHQVKFLDNLMKLISRNCVWVILICRDEQNGFDVRRPRVLANIHESDEFR